ncbi:MAG: tetratricopeptide repeat protein [Fidelibacterota bacterium]|nr:MAG: tetratricopeptide repeat protein [Candidatus Neomarinimicrobiota bacterium]
MNSPDAVQYHLERAIALDPDYSAPLFRLALYMQEQGRDPEAMQYLRQTVEVAGRSADMQAVRATEYGEHHQFDRARHALIKSHEEKALAARASYELALILLSTGDSGEAEKQFTQAVESDPTLADAYYQLGLMALRDDREKEARRFFENTVAVDLKHAQAHIELAKIISDDEDAELAKNHYLIALDLDADLRDEGLELRFE